jgi:D-alanyl-D-alanine carboxypeptidase
MLTRIVLLLALALLTPAPAAATVAPLPTCRYADQTASFDGDADWDDVVLDTAFRLPAGYTPGDLVAVTNAGVAVARSGMRLRTIVIADLRALDRAARRAGHRISIYSAYRSEAYQRGLYAAAVRAVGRTTARLYSARPGHSEHQLGTAIDIGTKGAGSPMTGDWAQTATGAWVNAHAWEYGFIRSYPRPRAGEGTRNPRSCYAYEPWHFRYVGRERAAAVHASTLTLREWLWATAH